MHRMKNFRVLKIGFSVRVFVFDEVAHRGQFSSFQRAPKVQILSSFKLEFTQTSTILVTESLSFFTSEMLTRRRWLESNENRSKSLRFSLAVHVFKWFRGNMTSSSWCDSLDVQLGETQTSFLNVSSVSSIRKSLLTQESSDLWILKRISEKLDFPETAFFAEIESVKM